MKKSMLIRAFFVKNKGASILVSTLMLVSIFVLCWIQGLYDYRMQYVNTLEKYAGGGDLYMRYISWSDQYGVRDMADEISEMPGVKTVMYNINTYWSDGTNDYLVYYYSTDIASRIDLGTNIREYSSGDTIECVACYGLADEGQVLKLNTIADETRGERSKPLKFKVMGTTNKDFKYLDFLTSGSNGILAASSIVLDVNVLFVSGEKFLEYVGEEQQYIDMNCYVIYESDATEEEISNARDYISMHGEYQEISTIVQTSKDTELKDIKHIIVIPALVLGVITFACLSIILLIMHTKMEEYSVYYLCGCSKRSIVSICFESLSFIIAIPCILNLLVIAFSDTINKMTGISFGTVIYSEKQIIFTLIYLIIMLVITGIIEFAMIARMSPVEMYRRMTR